MACRAHSRGVGWECAVYSVPKLLSILGRRKLIFFPSPPYLPGGSVIETLDMRRIPNLEYVDKQRDEQLRSPNIVSPLRLEPV